MAKTASASHGSFGVSASLNRRAGDVRVLTANKTALENRPEAFDGLSVNCAHNILPFGVVNNAMRIFTIEPLVANPLIGAKQADFVGDGFADERGESGGIHVRDHAQPRCPCG
jgi:hypothetical protein